MANHSSIIDYAVLSAATPFACIMQLQPGFLGFLQTRVLPCVGGLFFNRTEARTLVTLLSCRAHAACWEGLKLSGLQSSHVQAAEGLGITIAE